MRCQANRRRKGKELDDRIAKHRTRMARENSREGGNRGGKRHIMLASMRAKGTSAFNADAMNKGRRKATYYAGQRPRKAAHKFAEQGRYSGEWAALS